MNRLRGLQILICLASVTMVASCSRTVPFMPRSNIGNPTTLANITVPLQSRVSSNSVVQTSQSLTLSNFIDAGALGVMTENDKSEATSAQYYALQFGRPGAPRHWSGKGGNTGKITVGPFIRVNNMDCREFVHTVQIGESSKIRRGTSCRDINGRWSV